MNNCASGLIVGFLFGVSFFAGAMTLVGEYSVLYKQGQIDALSGNVKYHLVQQHDGSVSWRRIDIKE